MSNVLWTLIHGFLGKQQYAANAPSMLTTKFSKHLCLKCSTCAMFFNSSFTVSIIALFLSSSLSETLISAPFMLSLSFVMSGMPSTKSLSKRFLPISLVRDELPVDELHESLVFERLPVIHIPRRYHEVKQLALPVADKVQLEAEEPAHGTLAPLGDSLEDRVYVDSLVLAYTEWCAVNETDARTLAKQHLLDKQRQGNCHITLQLHKTVV